MNRSQRRHPERWNRSLGFARSPKETINNLKGLCIRNEKVGTKNVSVSYRSNKRGEPYRRNDGVRLQPVKIS